MAANALKNYTFLLPPELVERLIIHVNELGLASVDDAAKEAIEAYVKQLDRLQYRAAMQKAANDPEFRRDVENTMRDFTRID